MELEQDNHQTAGATEWETSSAHDLREDQGLEPYEQRSHEDDSDYDTGRDDAVNLRRSAAAETRMDAPIVPAATSRISPPTPMPPAPGLTLEQEEEFKKLSQQDTIEALRYFVQREVERAAQVAAASDYHLRQAEQEAPQFYKTNEIAVRQGLAKAPAELRGTPGAVAWATLYAIGDEVMRTGDLRGAVLRAAQLMNADTTQAAPTSRPAAPPSQRVPSAVGSAPAVRETGVRPIHRSGDNSVSERLQRGLGISRGTASRVVEDL